MKTFVSKPDNITKEWFVVDAEGKTLGRLASKVASVLRGKHKPTFSPSIDTGDFVIVTNAEKISVTGAKMSAKKYYNHSGYPGGIKEKSLEEMIAKKPEDVIMRAVKGMLPDGPLGRSQLKKLKVFAGPSHDHAAQTPKELAV